jgi:hypothetical protein
MIRLICTLEPVRISFLPQFLDHYSRLGVERFHLSLQVEPGADAGWVDHSVSEANAALAQYGTGLAAVLQKPFSSFVLREHHDRLQSTHASAGDWIVWSDIDEFQVYPGEFKSLIRLAESLEIDYFRGHFVDRLAADGKLRAFDPHQSIWAQYPRQFKLDPSLSPGMTQKVACARSGVQVSRGNHFALNEERLCYYAEPVEVHHFKWDASVVSRLKRRLQPDFQMHCPWWVESKAVLEFIEEHDGSLLPVLDLSLCPSEFRLPD